MSLFFAVLVASGCAPEPMPLAPLARAWVPAATRDAALVPLDAPRLARRLSLDLRGVLPSTEELDAVEADPGKRRAPDQSELLVREPRTSHERTMCVCAYALVTGLCYAP